MADGSEQSVVISDFSPGIYGDYHGGITSTSSASIPRNGAATIENTYECCADSTGALVPLPARTPDPWGTQVPFGDPAQESATYLLDAEVQAPFTSSVGTIPGAVGGPSVFTLWHANNPVVFAGAFDPGNYRMGRWWRRWESSTTVQDFAWNNVGSTPIGPGIQPGILTFARDESATTNILTDMHVVTTLSGGVDSGAYGPFEATWTSADSMVTGAFYGQMVTAFPDLANPVTNDFDNITNAGNFVYATGHQGRVVWIDRLYSSFNGGFWSADQLAYTSVANQLTSGITRGVYGEENTHQTGLIASLTADELLIIKDHGGGYLVKGDLDNPTVQRLPFLESTYGVTIKPALTPLGLVYATRNGVFLWAGGDTSKKLSEQIDGFFFRHEDTTISGEVYAGNRGRMDYWHPWVCLPNNYLYDTRNGAWWRLAAPFRNNSTPYNIYCTVPSLGQLYAFPYKITEPDQNQVWDVYDPAVLAGSYSWQSQPLIETRENYRAFQEVTIVASNGTNPNIATVTVTLTGVNHDGSEVSPATPVSVTFSIPATGSDRPVLLRKDILRNFNAMYVQVRIVASGNGGPAPKIHQLMIGTTDRQRFQKDDDQTTPVEPGDPVIPDPEGPDPDPDPDPEPEPEPPSAAFYTRDGNIGRGGYRFTPIGVNGVASPRGATGYWADDNPGSPFVRMGVMSGAMPSSSTRKAAAYKALGFNFVRFTCWYDPASGYTQTDFLNGLYDTMDEYLAQGIVCMPAYHGFEPPLDNSIGQNHTIAMFQADTYWNAWLTGICDRYKSNPNVWINPANEPYNYSNLAGWVTLQNWLYGQVRATGFNNIFVADLPGWAQSIEAATAQGVTFMTGKTNVAMGFHCYERGDVSTQAAACAAADVPIIVGEYGRAFGPPGGWGTGTVFQDSVDWVHANADTTGYGAVFWWGAGNRGRYFTLRDAQGATWYDTSPALNANGAALFSLAATRPPDPVL